MKTKTRKRLTWALGAIGAGLLLVAGSTWIGWRVMSPVGGSVEGFGGMLRVDAGARAPVTAVANGSFVTSVVVYRAHPFEVRAFRATRGYVLEIGSVILAGVGIASALAAAIVQREPRPRRGFCPKCRYDLRGLRPDDLTCPECGGAFEPGFGAPPVARPTV
jgi:hypothetical protein